MVRQPLWAITLLASAASLVPLPAADEPFRFPEGRHGDNAQLKHINGLPVLLLAGSPEEIGAGAGTLAVGPGKRALDYPRDLLKLHNVEAVWPIFVQTGTGMVKQFPPAYQQEMEALVKSSKVDRSKVIVGNTLFDLKKVFACSALMVDAERSATGGPLLARNLDYPSLGYINQYSLVTVCRPRGKHAFASVGFPGLIGVLSGMNDAGLALAVLEVFDIKDGERGFNPRGVPYAMNHRTLLEECTTIDEARRLLEKLPRTTTINLVLADKKGTAVFEVTPDRVEVRRATHGALACTNHYCTAPLKPAEPVNINRSFQRFDSLAGAQTSDAKLGVEDLRQHLHKVNLRNLTLQTMIFEPATLRLHLSIGAVPASQHAPRLLELAPLFRGELSK